VFGLGWIDHLVDLDVSRRIRACRKLSQFPLSELLTVSVWGNHLQELVEHHFQEEESRVWMDAKAHFSSDERAALNRQYLTLKARVKVP
jgi:hypothetical protein